jgi:hypothetical protein
MVYKGHAYLPYNLSGLLCVELATGNVAGQVKTGTGCGPIAADGRLWTPSRMVKADPADFRLLEMSDRKSPIAIGPYLSCTYVDGFIYARGIKHISCYDVRKK